MKKSKVIEYDELSVTEYAAKLGISRSALLIKISNTLSEAKSNRLAEGVTAKLIGQQYVIKIPK